MRQLCLFSVKLASKEEKKNEGQKVSTSVVSTGQQPRDHQASDTHSSRVSYKPQKINFKASQVIDRGEKIQNGIPLGSNLIGKLISSIDTRDPNSFIKVLLPMEESLKQGTEFPKIILLGQVSYSGRGEKIFLKFNRGVTPDGVEF